jgi:hypothetical protein
MCDERLDQSVDGRRLSFDGGFMTKVSEGLTGDWAYRRQYDARRKGKAGGLEQSH